MYGPAGSEKSPTRLVARSRALEDARRAGLDPSCAPIPDRCWSALRASTILAAAI
jgi:hypothetical protein